MAPGGNNVVRTSGLFFGYYAKLDLNDNDLIVDYASGAGNISLLGQPVRLVQRRLQLRRNDQY